MVMGKSSKEQQHSSGSVVQRENDPKELRLKFVLPSKKVKKEEEEEEYVGNNGVTDHTTSPTNTTRDNQQEVSDDNVSDDFSSGESDNNTPPSKREHWEECLIGGEEVNLPSSLVQLGDLSSIFSLHVWRDILSNEDRVKLSSFLPPPSSSSSSSSSPSRDAPHTATLHSLFNGDNIYFGNPILNVARDLQAGEFNEQLVRKRGQLRYAQRAQYIHNLRIYHFKMVDQIIKFRRSLGLSDTAQIHAYTNKVQALSQGNANSAPSSPITTQRDENMQDTASNKPSSDTDSNSEIEVETTPTKKGKRKQSEGNTRTENKRSRATKRARVNPKPSDEEVRAPRSRKERASKATLDGDLVKKEILSPQKLDPEYESSPSPNAVPAFLLFFTIRNYLEVNSYSASLSDIVRNAEKIPLLVTHTPPFFELPEFVKLAMLFLSKPPVLSSAAQNSQQPGGGSGTGIMYEESIMRYDKGSQRWHWLDIDRTRLSGAAGEEHLQSLEQLFYFATARNMTNPIDGTVDLSITMNRQQKCILTIETSTDEMVETYQQQETERYKIPEKAFMFVINKFTYIVAPMKRGVGNPGNKPREHFLLKPDRPPHINLLCLVRDAAARLPGGVGTRPDVALLLRDSQYVVESASDQQLNTVVSGALDRLHSEKDPCVKFDSEQKLWVYPITRSLKYLHRHRTEADFSPCKPRIKRGGRSKKEKDQPMSPTQQAPTPTLQAQHKQVAPSQKEQPTTTPTQPVQRLQRFHQADTEHQLQTQAGAQQPKPPPQSIQQRPQPTQ